MIIVRYILDEDEDTEDADEDRSSFHSQAAVSGSAIFLAGEAGIRLELVVQRECFLSRLPCLTEASTLV